MQLFILDDESLMCGEATQLLSPSSATKSPTEWYIGEDAELEQTDCTMDWYTSDDLHPELPESGRAQLATIDQPDRTMEWYMADEAQAELGKIQRGGEVRDNRMQRLITLGGLGLPLLLLLHGVLFR